MRFKTLAAFTILSVVGVMPRAQAQSTKIGVITSLTGKSGSVWRSA
jgi:hypothetical protein